VAEADTFDYYGSCQNGVMTLLRTLPYFPKAIQVTDNRNNINIGAEYWAVFIPSTFSSSKLDPHNKRYIWQILFDLYVRYHTAAEAIAKFREVRSAIINLLDVHPTLHSPAVLTGVPNVEDVLVSARSELLQDVPGDNPNFLIQTMAVAVTQRVRRKF
jgi:hypothetical protein